MLPNDATRETTTRRERSALRINDLSGDGTPLIIAIARQDRQGCGGRGGKCELGRTMSASSSVSAASDA